MNIRMLLITIIMLVNRIITIENSIQGRTCFFNSDDKYNNTKIINIYQKLENNISVTKRLFKQRSKNVQKSCKNVQKMTPKMIQKMIQKMNQKMTQKMIQKMTQKMIQKMSEKRPKKRPKKSAKK